MIHRANKVHVKNQRQAANLAKSTIGKTDTVSFDELCGCGLVCIGGQVISVSWSMVDTFIDDLDLRSSAISE